MLAVVGVDVGGTFTDVVVYDGTTVTSWKTPTTKPQSGGVVEALSRFASGEGFHFLHGTTAATNALLEGKGARVVFVTSAGFEDLIEIGRQARPALYDPSVDRPVPLASRSDRIGHAGIEQTLDALIGLEPDALAVGLLNSFRDPEEEKALSEAIRLAHPDVPLSVSSQVSPGFREYERFATTLIDAYLAPGVSGYLGVLNDQIAATSASVMTSSGGLLPFSAAESAVGTLTLSGPAAGVVASDSLLRALGIESVITFDMGGTSTDVSRIGSEGVVLSSTQVIAGRVNRVPSMPIHTVGAGGGSIAWVDSGGALRVGPASAGAHPGPAAYGLGGDEATVTDANLYLGYILEETTFSTGLNLRRTLADDVLTALGGPLGLSARETAFGILRVVDAHMDSALRKVSIEEGFDAREASLVAFGGAGGLHASRLRRGLGMRSVLVPPHAGVFAALGLLMSRPRLEQLRTVLVDSESSEVVEMAGAIGHETAQRFIDIHGERPGEMELLVDVRYESQSHELSIPYRDKRVRSDFIAEHRSRFGFDLEDSPVEVVNVRGVAYGEAPITWDAIGFEPRSTPESIQRPMWVGDDEVLVDVWKRVTLPAGFEIEGPALIVDGTASVLAEPDDRVRVLDDGTLEIT
ncbi:MAG: hydantoinase/oxoprolinase family protein [Acidimicrobiia bacterium]|nr:hydantoinase/oxoprolinase family protein [Acidimicrobiia bacterium]